MRLLRSLHLPSLLIFLALGSAGCSDQAVNANNTPPTATIDQPTVGTEVLEGSEVTFAGTVQDRTTPEADLELTWSSSLDGELLAGAPDAEGFTTFATSELSPGTHTITLQVRDADGASGQATVDLVVTPDAAPTISIVEPTATGVYYANLPVTLQATANDAEDLPADLRVSWAIDGGAELVTDLAPDSTGLTTSSTDLAAGTYVLIATATDTGGNTATDTVTITVGPPNTSPTCAITAPESQSSFPIGDLVTFEGTVGDVDVPADWLTVEFESNVDGPLGAATPSTAGDVALAVSTLTAATHTVTMSVADEVGGTCSAFVLVTISTPPTATIDAPVANTTVNDNETVAFAGVVADAEDAETNLTVEWTSSLDGALGNSTPDSSGIVGLTVTGLTAGTHVVTLTATDSVGLTGTDTVTLEVNASPTAPVVSITPASPLTTDDLSVVIDTPSTDPDNGPSGISYTYEWSLNGNPAPAYSGLLTIPAADTAILQTWSVAVIATDGLATSAAGTAAVSISNSIPSITSATVSPTTAYTNTLLTATPAGWSDADGDSPAYMYEWFSGTTAIGTDSPTLSGTTEFDKNESITVQVTPIDASSSGTPVVSNAVVILNTPPTAPGVTVTPSGATDADDLICTVTTLSSDDDPNDTPTYTYAWLQNGSPTGLTGSTLASANTTAGETWTCQVTPNDGQANGPTGSDSEGPLGTGCVPGDGTDAACASIDCETILDGGFSTGDGFYWIDPLGSGAPYEVFCLMDPVYDGGGWTLIATFSDDGQDTWTWTNRHYLDTDTTTFGSLSAIENDFKSPAYHDVTATEVLFLHAPSGVWASYDLDGGASTTLADVVQAAGAPSTQTAGTGVAMNAGTLVAAGYLNETRLYYNAIDCDGGTDHSYGPTWNSTGNATCQFDDPGNSGVGPMVNYPVEAPSNPPPSSTPSGHYGGTRAVVGIGFGMGANLNTGTPQTSANHLQTLTR